MTDLFAEHEIKARRILNGVDAGKLDPVIFDRVKKAFFIECAYMVSCSHILGLVRAMIGSNRAIEDDEVARVLRHLVRVGALQTKTYKKVRLYGLNY